MQIVQCKSVTVLPEKYGCLAYSIVDCITVSIGDYYGQGRVRVRELLKSAAVLGIDESRVKVVNDRNLPDDPHVEWDRDVVGNYVMEMVTQFGIDIVRLCFSVFCSSSVYSHLIMHSRVNMPVLRLCTVLTLL